MKASQIMFSAADIPLLQMSEYEDLLIQLSSVHGEVRRSHPTSKTLLLTSARFADRLPARGGPSSRDAGTDSLSCAYHVSKAECGSR